MKHLTPKKLTLSPQTLRRLDAANLREIQGGNKNRTQTLCPGACRDTDVCTE